MESWRSIYLKQLDGLADSEMVQTIRHYYETSLSERHLLQILGHEFVHHSTFFPDTDYQRGIWFEEGMCEYISRKYFLTDQEFQEEAEVNRLLVELHRERYGAPSLEQFGSATYRGDYAGIFFEYWRSFLAVQQIMQAHGSDIFAVFRCYQTWLHSGSTQPLAQWLRLE